MPQFDLRPVVHAQLEATNTRLDRAEELRQGDGLRLLDADEDPAPAILRNSKRWL